MYTCKIHTTDLPLANLGSTGSQCGYPVYPGWQMALDVSLVVKTGLGYIIDLWKANTKYLSGTCWSTYWHGCPLAWLLSCQLPIGLSVCQCEDPGGQLALLGLANLVGNLVVVDLTTSCERTVSGLVDLFAWPADLAAKNGKNSSLAKKFFKVGLTPCCWPDYSQWNANYQYKLVTCLATFSDRGLINNNLIWQEVSRSYHFFDVDV